MKVTRAGFLIVILIVLIVVFGPFRAGVFSDSSEKLELWVDDDPGCEGHSPCYSSIQTAIDTVPTDGEGFIYVLPGSYEENLVIQGKEIILRGSGAEVSMISAPDPTKPAILISDLRELELGYQSVGISGFKITGGLVGVKIERAASATVSQNQIIITGEAGLRVMNSTRINIEENEIRGWGSRPPDRWQEPPAAIILGEGLGEVEIADNYIYTYELGYGIKIASGEDIAVRGNKIEGDNGILIESAGRVLVESNLLVTNTGILMHDPEKARIKWNVIQAHGTDGLGVGILPIQEGSIVEPVIAHNLIMGGAMGIGVSVLTHPDYQAQPELRAIIEYNTIQNIQVGIGVNAPPVEEYGRLAKLTIRYNLLQNNERGLLTPFFVFVIGGDQGGGSQLHIEGNRFEINVIGVELGAGVRADLLGNSISQNTNGIVLKDGWFSLERNRIIYNRGYGIAINASGYCRVEGAYGEGVPEAIEGEDNEIHDNGNDLCPDGYSWPEGFVKGDSG